MDDLHCIVFSVADVALNGSVEAMLSHHGQIHFHVIRTS